MPTTLSTTREQVRARQDEALALREQGMTYLQISQALGYGSANGGKGREAARQAVMKALARRMQGAKSTRRFGAEIEFTGIPRYVAEAALRAAGINAVEEGYNHQTKTYWKLISDASVSGFGNELVSPILQGEKGLAELSLVIKTLKDAGAKVDRTCGLHIHHEAADMTGEEIARLVEMYSVNQDNIDTVVSRSRRNSRWARHWNAYELDSLKRYAANGRDMRHYSGNRYRTVNLQSFVKYGTVEFRQHGGNLNPETVIAWVRFGQALMDAAKAAVQIDAEASLDALLEKLNKDANLEEAVVAHLKRRAATLRRR